MENNWLYKSLENLEKESWKISAYSSNIVKRCHELRRIPLNEFTTENLRIMIGQNIGLTYLIPLALEILEKDILAEGDYYPGDLLMAIIKVSPEFWADNSVLHVKLKNLIVVNRKLIEKEGLKIGHY